MEAASNKDKTEIQPNGQGKEPASPVCYTNSDEVRDEFKDGILVEEDNERDELPE